MHGERSCSRRTLPLAAFVLVLSASVARAEEPTGPHPPVVLSSVPPAYPSEEIARGTHGDVALVVTVDASGNVSDVSVARPLCPGCDREAIMAARKWRFAPASRDAVPVVSRIQLLVHFEPPAPPPAAPPPPSLPSAIPPPPAAEAGAIDVTVLGRRPPPSRGASDYQISVEKLAEVPHGNASDLLKLAPGILLTNEGGEGHAEQVFLRGFDAREGQDIEFSVGGVPINESGNPHGNGYADTHFIIPELVEGLRVLEGPFDPRQGNYAVAGSADYALGLADRGLAASYTAGSWNTRRLLLAWGPEAESRHTFGAVEAYKSAGFGRNRDAERATAMAQYEGRLGDRGTYRLLGTAYATTYHTAGIIREDDYEAGRIGFYDTYDFRQGGEASRFGLAADIENRVAETTYTEQVFATLRGMRLRENFTGFLLDVQDVLQRPHDQRGDLIDLDTHETTLGSRGSARTRLTWLGVPQELELGYLARLDWVQGSQQRIAASVGFPYATDSNLDSQLTDIGGYLDADLRPWRRLSLRGGLRADAFTFDVNNLCAQMAVAHPAQSTDDASCVDQVDFGKHREANQRSSTGTVAVLPRASVLLGPILGVTLSGSYGLGVRSVDPSYITQDVKTPFAGVQAYEGGVAYSHNGDRLLLVARASVFRTHVDRDLLFSQTAGRNVLLATGTLRTGVVGALRATGRFFDEAINATLVRSTFDDNHLLVPYVPDLVVRSDGALFRDLRLPWLRAPVRASLALGATYVGRRALPFSERSDTNFTIDGQARLRWRGLQVALAATNIRDRRYRLGEFNFASDFGRDLPGASGGAATPTLVPIRHFTAGAPRSLFLTVGFATEGL
jgi:iron complex outermembrane receptor protein